MACAPLIRTGPARLTVAARHEDLDHDPVPGTNTPTCRGPTTDLLEHADRLVARDERKTREQLAGERLMIGATQAARLNSQQSVVVADHGKRELAKRKVPRCLKD